ncbi:MAG: hypothetical protein ACRDRD_22665, partial [Pseudonocardiaceae bacterium]
APGWWPQARIPRDRLPAGGGSLLGARPIWAGDMTSADFRPDVPCAGQALPSLGSSVAVVGMHAVRSPAAPALHRAQLRAATLARVAALTKPRKPR